MEENKFRYKKSTSRVLLEKFIATESIGGQLSLLMRFSLRAVVPLFDALEKNQIEERDFIAALRCLNEIINLEPSDFANLNEVELNPLIHTEFEEPIELGDVHILSHGIGKYQNSVAMSLSAISTSMKIYFGVLEQFLHPNAQDEQKLSLFVEQVGHFFEGLVVSYIILRGHEGMRGFLDANYLGMADNDAARRAEPHDIFNHELFDSEFASLIESEIAYIRRPHGSSGAKMAFWHEWYQGFLDGKPLDWKLQRRVAQIEDEFWDAGPDTVAKEIEKIREKFDLEKRIEELEAELRFSTVNRHGIGGNMPPEMLDDAPIAQELAFVWKPLEDLKEEIAKDDSDPKRLQRIIEALVAALKKGFAWCLKKGDLVVDTAIKWAIPAAGTGYLTLNPEKLEAVIEAAKKLLSVP